MSTIQKGDFVEIDYTGIVKDEALVFDTTDKEVAHQYGLDDGKRSFNPMIICVGEGYLLQGVENNLVDKELGDYEFDVSAEEGFGKKDANLVQLIPTSKFRKQGINPQPGQHLNIDNSVGVVKTVSGGRTIIDFNHPLAGKELTYKVRAHRIVSDPAEKVSALLKIQFNTGDLDVQVEENKATVDISSVPMLQRIPQDVLEKVKEELLRLVPELGEIEFKGSQQQEGQDSGSEQEPTGQQGEEAAE